MAISDRRPLPEEPSARAVRFLLEKRALELVLKTDVVVQVPLTLISELASATDEQLSQHLGLSPSGGAITCRPLDVDIAVDGLLLDVLGAAGWKHAIRAALAREIAGSRSPRKAAASRENGKKGGRPGRERPGERS